MPNRRKLFLSYSRESAGMAGELVADLRTMGHSVWHDNELSGGQEWWQEILAEIRQADVFVFVLDQHSVNSLFCLAELDYARALGKPILPVRIADVSIGLPPEIARRQLVNHVNSDRQSALELARAFNLLPTVALPQPLPEPPPQPAHSLGKLTAKIRTSGVLSRLEQIELYFDLEALLQDPQANADATELLRQFRARADLLSVIAKKAEHLLKKSAPPVKLPAPEVSAEDYWVDPATSLMWTKRDNGRYLSYSKAVEYAASLRLGGYSDWRLPTVEELRSIYDPSVRTHVKGGLELTSTRQWCSVHKSTGKPQYFIFPLGEPYDAPYDNADKVLCVRTAEA